MEKKFKYTAFISYSHADQAVVKWLHHALEQYGVPEALVGKETSAGKVPKKFDPFFRDRDDLSAAANLTSSIKEALSQSKFLIVVCSPSATNSKWVEKEIQQFKKLRGDDYILCLIADTDPTGKIPTFPRALWDDANLKKKGYFEPIAADMRPSGDGKRMAKLKLISGLLGVELDTLVQREAKRRQVQMVVMTATFSLATVVLAVLLFMATEARKEAEANRQEAENLVGFMLGDLREKLEPIGSLQILDTISIRALDYYANIEPEKMTSDGLRDRSRVLLMLGETQELRGNTSAARSAFMEAFLTTEELLKRDPRNLDLIFDHAQSTYWLGFADLRQKNYQSAENYFQKYAENTEILISLKPENQGYQAEVGYAYSNLGIVQFSQGKFMDAQEDFEKALTVSITQAEENPASPDARFDLAQAYAWLSESKKELGRFEEAEDLRQKERRIYTVILNNNPDNRNIWGALAGANRALGALKFHRGNEKASLAFFDKGIEILESLIAYDPENTEWRETLTQIYIDKSRAFIAGRDFSDAQSTLEKALNLNTALLAINPDFSNWILGDFKARVLMAEVRLKSRKRKEGLGMAQMLASEFYERFPPETRTSELHFLSAEILDLLAEAYARTGDKDAARENWNSVVKILKPFEETGGVTVDLLLPKARKKIGE